MSYPALLVRKKTGQLLRSPGETLRLPLRSRVHLPIPRGSRFAGRKPTRKDHDHEGHVNGSVAVKAWRKNAVERLWGLDAVDVKG